MPRVSGSPIEQTIQSRVLQKPMRLFLYLPPYYGEFKMRYPVVYLLHPWNRNERYFEERLGLKEVADRLIYAGVLPPFVAVMPQGDKSFFINAANPGGDFSMVVQFDPKFFEGALEGFGDYGDYILDDVLPAIERHYEVRTDRAGRVIAGISMGGAGAAVLAFTNPDLFGGVGIHSPALFTSQRLGPPWIFGLADEEAFARRDPIHLAQHLDPRSELRIYLDCGQEDELAEPAALLHRVLEERGIQHTYISRPGGHNGEYWRAHFPEYLGFYAAGW